MAGTDAKPRLRGLGALSRGQANQPDVGGDATRPSPRPAAARSRRSHPLPALIASAGPVLAVLAVVIMLWYALAVWLNAAQAIERTLSSQPGWRAADLVHATWTMGRPVLPAPHQIARDLANSIFDWPLDSPRNLLHHAAVTSSAALLGFVMGTLLGAVLAAAIVHSRTLERGLLPWIIASQTVPVLAIAPIVIVILGSVGLTGTVPKSIISMYLCFFPVTVALVKGFRSPGAIESELLQTYAASTRQVFWKLRVPASLPFLFPALRIGIAAGFVGAIVGELPTGAQAGLGARMLTGSYYGNTVQIWSALAMASLVGALLTGCVALAGRALTPGGRGDHAMTAP